MESVRRGTRVPPRNQAQFFANTPKLVVRYGGAAAAAVADVVAAAAAIDVCYSSAVP